MVVVVVGGGGIGLGVNRPALFLRFGRIVEQSKFLQSCSTL